MTKTCQKCGAGFTANYHAKKFCSISCYRAFYARKIGTTPTNWRDSGHGYIQGTAFIDGEYRIISQHRYFMEQHLGRKLREDEHIHHINGCKTDNRIENLQILTPVEHAKLEAALFPFRAKTKNLFGARRAKGGKWAAGFNFRCRFHYSGIFNTEQEAHQASLAKFEGLKNSTQPLPA